MRTRTGGPVQRRTGCPKRRTRTGTEAVALIALALFASLSACKKKSGGAPDGGTPGTIRDEDLGFELALSPGWSPGKKSSDTTIAELYRSAPPGRTFLVMPRLAVTAEKTGARDTDALVRATAGDLQSLDRNPGVRIKRTAIGSRTINGVKTGEIELSYELKAPNGGDSKREVVHRSLVTRRERKDGSIAALTVTATYLGEDADLVSPEVQRIFGSLVFMDRGTGERRP